MYPIQEQQWQQLNIRTWQDLNPHLWECFRQALMQTTTEQEVQGVVVEYSSMFNETLTELKGKGVRVEFSPTIVSNTTEMIVNIVVSKRDYKSSMLDCLPWYERKSEVFDNILNCYDKELRMLEQNLDIVERNMFIDTSVEHLKIYERDLGIKNIKALGYDQRREQISSRYVSSFDQTTEDTIRSVASAFGNGEVEISETISPGLYEIKFIGTGIPNNLEGLKEALDIVVPAHLGFEYTLSGNTHEIVKKLTWGEAKMKTWNELIRWEGAS